MYNVRKYLLNSTHIENVITFSNMNYHHVLVKLKWGDTLPVNFIWCDGAEITSSIYSQL